MASRALLRSLRTSCPHLSSRSYVTQARTYTPRVYTAKAATAQVPKTFASTTTPGAGNPEIIDTLPSTANEINVEAEAPAVLPATFPEAPTGGDVVGTDWSKSYHGLSTQAFSKEAGEVLMAPLDPLDIEMKPGAHFFCSAYHSMQQLTISYDGSQTALFISLKSNIDVFSTRPSARVLGASLLAARQMLGPRLLVASTRLSVKDGTLMPCHHHCKHCYELIILTINNQ